MVKSCAFLHCKRNKRVGKEQKCSFHRFPLGNSELLRKWIAAVDRDNWNPSSYDLVCSEHFLEEEIFVQNGKHYLRDNIVPTKNLKGIQVICVAEEQPSQFSSSSKTYGKIKPSSSSSIHAELTGNEAKVIESEKKNVECRTSSETLVLTDTVGIVPHNDITPESVKWCSITVEAVNSYPIAFEEVNTCAITVEAVNTFAAPVEAGNTSMTTDEGVICDQTSAKALYKPKNDLEDYTVQSVHENDNFQEFDYPPPTKTLEYHLRDHNYSGPDHETLVHSLKRKLASSEEKNRALENELLCVKRKLQRRDLNLSNLKDLLNGLRNKNLLLEEHAISINENFTSTAKKLFEQLKELGIKNQKKKAYTEEIKQFALTLHFYSPKAYEYLRQHFTLPHENTLREWSSRINGEPGFTKQSFEFLEEQAKKSPVPVLVALNMDGMAIRKHVEWCGEYFSGFVDYGMVSNNSQDSQTVASQALVFRLVAINGSWKIPLGYFFLHGTPGWLLTQLVKECFAWINATGVKCVALVCDGLSSNLTMAKTLGANLDPEYLDPSFINPANPMGDRIYLILDVVHMIKLLRNLWSDFVTIYNGSTDEIISWDFVKQLHKLQEKEGLVLANKLNKFHVYWKTQKMKVKLAVQVMSNSVAKALTFLEQTSVPGFQGCGATVAFIESLDRCFDILNSRSPYAKGYKAPIRHTSFNQIQESLLQTKDLLLNLKDHEGALLACGTRKTGPLGLAASITSIIEISKRYLLPPDSPLKYLLTYKFSQDHEELYFNTIRRQGGWNNNPTTKQFTAAYRKSLAARLTPSSTGNVTSQDEMRIPTLCSSFRYSDNQGVSEYQASTLHGEIISDEELDEFTISQNNSSIFLENAVYYIAGFVISRLCKKMNCRFCEQSLQAQPNEHDYAFSAHSRFTQLKDNGGLKHPSKSVLQICALTESCIRQNVSVDMKTKNISLSIEIAVMRKLVNANVFSELQEHMFDFEIGIEHHRNRLMKNIINLYTKVRLHKIAKDKNLQLKKQAIRHKLSKLVLFQGQ